VNGLAFGGGTEISINSDIVIASKNASFCLPEVKRGLVAVAGAPPRLIRTVGRQRAMEMALTGRPISATEAEKWGLVNHVIEGGNEEVVKAALEVAKSIADNSPDAVIVSRQGVAIGWEGVGAEEGTRIWQETWYGRLLKGDNMKGTFDYSLSRVKLRLTITQRVFRHLSKKESLFGRLPNFENFPLVFIDIQFQSYICYHFSYHSPLSYRGTAPRRIHTIE
jgi:hypothetical protein